MKRWVGIFVLGLMTALPLQAQRRSNGVGPSPWTPRYELTITEVDWKTQTLTGVGRARIEQQVRTLLSEGLGWVQRVEHGNPRRKRPPEGSVEVKLDIAADRQKGVAYHFRVIVHAPENWPRIPRPQGGLVAWKWEGSRKGVSTLGNYPEHFRKDMNAVMQDLAKAWKARFE